VLAGAVALTWNHGLSPRELNVIRRLVVNTKPGLLKHGMTAPVGVKSRISHVKVTDGTINSPLGRWAGDQSAARVVVATVGWRAGATGELAPDRH